MPSLKIKQTDCVATNLQLIFTLMKESIRKSIDPNFFIKALGLDENMQQVRKMGVGRGWNSIYDDLKSI